MLKSQSPLGSLGRFEGNDVLLSEAPGFTLHQIAGEEEHLKKVYGKLPGKVGVVVEIGDRRFFRVGPKQFWVLGDLPPSPEGVYVTPLSSGRCRIQLEGKNARTVLSACAIVDFDVDAFMPGQFVLTGIHHTPVTIQCIEENVFHIFALRTFALNVWEWLCDVAEGLDNA